MGRHHPFNLFISALIALIATLCFFNVTHASADREIRLFVVEKSKNPQNILVVYAKIDSACMVQPIADAGSLHLFDLYWLMSGSTFKPTHRLIKKAARKRFVAQGLADHGQSFSVLLADLKELTHDLPSDRIDVEMYKDPSGQCSARVLLILGPSHANRTMAIETIYSEAKTFLTIPVGIHYIELRGKDSLSGEPIVARFNSSRQDDEKVLTDKSQETNMDAY